MKVLLDTSAMIALVLQGDSHHREAREFLRTRGLVLLTNSFVMAEFYTHLQRRFGAPTALRAYDQLTSNAAVAVVPWSMARDESTYAVLRKLQELPLSYADASLVAQAREFSVATIFAFDDDFRLAGLTVAPG